MTPPVCLHCDEPITDGDIAWTPVFFANGHVQNREQHTVCGMRSLIGGLNHLRGRCTCCGGDEPPDPPNMTRLQAAKAAVAYFWQRHAAPDDGCCHKTRIKGSPCPIGRKCPYIPDATGKTR